MPFKTILFILFLSNLVFSQGTGCTQHMGENGFVVDLSSLQGVVFNATHIYDSVVKSYYDYEFVACGTIPNSKMAKCPSKNPISSMCLEYSGGALNLGIFNSTNVTENALVINYDGGDVDVGTIPVKTASATLTITCDPKMNTINVTSVNYVLGTIHYDAHATSKYACSLICNGHGKYTSSACICDLGYSGTYCNLFLVIDPYVFTIVVEGVIIVALVIIIILLYRRLKSYTSMSSTQMNNMDF